MFLFLLKIFFEEHPTTHIIPSCICSVAQAKVYTEIIGDEYATAGHVQVRVVFCKNTQRYASMLKNENGKKFERKRQKTNNTFKTHHE